MTRPHGHPLGSVPATLALSDWERRTALAGPVEVDETEDDDPGADLPEWVLTTEETMSDRLNEIEALVGFLGSDTITNGSQAHVALADLVKFAREVEALHAPFETQIDGRDTTSCRHCLELDNAPGDQPWDYTWPCPTAAAVQRLGGA